METHDPTMGEMSPETLPDTSAARRRISATGWALLAFAAALAVALFLTGWEDAVHAVQALSIWQFFALCGLALSHYVIRAIRWHVMVRTGSVILPWTTSLLHFFAGFAMTATPGRVGELVRLRWLMRATDEVASQLADEDLLGDAPPVEEVARPE